MIKLIDLLEEISKRGDLDKLLDYLNKYDTPINNNSKIIAAYGRLKINSDEVYDFGGSENPVPNSIVVDIEDPDGDNEFIEQDLEDVFSLPPKQYINVTSVIHFIINKNNLVKSIDNSLKPGGLLILKSSLGKIIEILPYLSNYTPIEAQIDEEEILTSDDDPDAITIVFQK